VFHLFDEFGVENCKIELVERCPCNSQEELRKREGEHIKDNECVNKVVAGRTNKEAAQAYYDKNKEKICEYGKQWYQENKESVAEHNKLNEETIRLKKQEYYELNRDAILEKKQEYYLLNRERKLDEFKEYYSNNVEKKKQYREKHKDKLCAKITCEVCGHNYTFENKSKHFKTTRHQQALP
jgi:hypothetical protein